MRTHVTAIGAAVITAALSWVAGCRSGLRTIPPPPPAPPAVVESPAPAVVEYPPGPAAEARVTRLGYTVQVGAFAVLANARTLVRELTAAGLDAFYFPAGSGLYKVRFGDFPSKETALAEAKRMMAEARIKDYFIVSPGDYAVNRPPALGVNLRDRLAATAEDFIGVEYTWGGTTSRSGFDCSGLVRAVYQLNGLNLPRSVYDQYGAGTAVPKDRLERGDLVFFSATPGGELSHVGIYVGGNVFIHAPGKGKRVRRDSLDTGYFREHFSGARAYVRASPPGGGR